MASFNEKPQKCFPVRITTMDADLEFKVEHSALGRDLFDLVCRTLGLREIWYFGLQFSNSKGYYCWLQMGTRVLKQDVRKAAVHHFHFLVKFYPESVEDELIQDATRHLFFLQIKQAILSMDVYCPPEASVLVASYAVQAKYGDCDEATVTEGLLLPEELLPQRVIDQYQMTAEMWEERIKTWWSNNKGLSREDAELEYLKIAQDLDMYGVHYFPIHNKKESDLWLGVCAYGVNIYAHDNRLHPKTRFQWSEIKNISFKDKKFTIKTATDCSSVSFWSQNTAVNQVILDLCVGTHNLYLRRRQPDSLEMQQMKAQSKEERLRRQAEHNKLAKEKGAREELELERKRLKLENEQLLEQVRAAQEAMQRTEETAELLAEKARISEEEALVLAKRASEAEAEIQRIKISAIKTEEEKILMERKAREAELIANRVLEESERRNKEADKLKLDLRRARQAEAAAKDKLREVTGGTTLFGAMDGALADSYSFGEREDYRGLISYPPDPLMARGVGQDMRSLSAEIEKERIEYVEKSRHLQEQLSELRSEIEGLKVEDRQTHLDRLYAENLLCGDDKYSTLRKSGAGSTKNRVQLFEGL